MKYQKSINEFRNESRHEIERNKPMVRLDTQKMPGVHFACFPEIAECGNANTMENAEMPEIENARN